MIAVDTNVVLRRLLHDDAEQSVKADRLFNGVQPILITDVVLAEVAWTLTGKRYRASREDVVVAMTSLFEEPRVQFEDRDAVWGALAEYREATPVKTANGSRTADFADALIVRKASTSIAALGERYGGTYTFDRPAQQLAGMKPL